MKWVVIIGVILYLYYRFVMVKAGNLQFWKIANSNPDEAYMFFMASENFFIFEENLGGGYRKNLPPGEWDGPFKLFVPSKRISVTIFGRVPDYEVEQDKFMGEMS